MDIIRIHDDFRGTILYKLCNTTPETLKKHLEKNPKNAKKINWYYYDTEKDPEYGYSILSYVVDEGKYEFLPILLSYDANPNQYNVSQKIDEYDYNRSVHSSIIYHLVLTHIKNADKMNTLGDFMKIVKKHSKIKFDIGHLNHTLKYVLGQIEESANAKTFAEVLLSYDAKPDMFIEEQMFLINQSSSPGICYSEENNLVFQSCLDNATNFIWEYTKSNIIELCKVILYLNTSEIMLILDKFVPNIPDRKKKLLKLIIDMKCDRLNELD